MADNYGGAKPKKRLANVQQEKNKEANLIKQSKACNRMITEADEQTLTGSAQKNKVNNEFENDSEWKTLDDDEEEGDGDDKMITLMNTSNTNQKIKRTIKLDQNNLRNTDGLGKYEHRRLNVDLESATNLDPNSIHDTVCLGHYEQSNINGTVAISSDDGVEVNTDSTMEDRAKVNTDTAGYADWRVNEIRKLSKVKEQEYLTAKERWRHSGQALRRFIAEKLGFKQDKEKMPKKNVFELRKNSGPTTDLKQVEPSARVGQKGELETLQKVAQKRKDKCMGLRSQSASTEVVTHSPYKQRSSEMRDSSEHCDNDSEYCSRCLCGRSSSNEHNVIPKVCDNLSCKMQSKSERGQSKSNEKVTTANLDLNENTYSDLKSSQEHFEDAKIPRSRSFLQYLGWKKNKNNKKNGESIQMKKSRSLEISSSDAVPESSTEFSTTSDWSTDHCATNETAAVKNVENGKAQNKTCIHSTKACNSCKVCQKKKKLHKEKTNTLKSESNKYKCCKSSQQSTNISKEVKQDDKKSTKKEKPWRRRTSYETSEMENKLFGVLDDQIESSSSSEEEYEFIFDEEYGEVVRRVKDKPTKQRNSGSKNKHSNQSDYRGDRSRSRSQELSETTTQALSSLQHAIPYLPERFKNKLQTIQNTTNDQREVTTNENDKQMVNVLPRERTIATSDNKDGKTSIKRQIEKASSPVIGRNHSKKKEQSKKTKQAKNDSNDTMDLIDRLEFESSLEDPFHLRGRPDLDLCNGLMDLVKEIDIPFIDEESETNFNSFDEKRNENRKWKSELPTRQMPGSRNYIPMPVPSRTSPEFFNARMSEISDSANNSFTRMSVPIDSSQQDLSYHSSRINSRNSPFSSNSRENPTGLSFDRNRLGHFEENSESLYDADFVRSRPGAAGLNWIKPVDKKESARLKPWTNNNLETDAGHFRGTRNEDYLNEEQDCRSSRRLCRSLRSEKSPIPLEDMRAPELIVVNGRKDEGTGNSINSSVIDVRTFDDMCNEFLRNIKDPESSAFQNTHQENASRQSKSSELSEEENKTEESSEKTTSLEGFLHHIQNNKCPIYTGPRDYETLLDEFDHFHGIRSDLSDSELDSLKARSRSQDSDSASSGSMTWPCGCRSRTELSVTRSHDCVTGSDESLSRLYRSRSRSHDSESRSKSSDESVVADDEFECECDHCQLLRQHSYNRNNLDLLPPRLPTSDLWQGYDLPSFQDMESEDRYEMDNSFGSPVFLDEFDFIMDSSRNEFDWLVIDSRPLSDMLEDVIQQMLAVQPELLNETAAPPASQRVIDNLPTLAMTASHLDQHPSCPICLCLSELEEVMTLLPCQHVFHPICIQAWLIKSGTCPVCRARLPR